MPMPMSMASRGERKCCSSPLTRMRLIGRLGTVEDLHQRRLAGAVLPTMAWIVPGITVRLTPSLATTPGKRFTMSRNSMAAVCPPVVTAHFLAARKRAPGNPGALVL